MADLVLPIVHLNGTSRGSLISDRRDVVEALDTARQALANAAPNARDYYPEPGRFEKAVEQHARRMKNLWDLEAEIQAEVEALVDPQ